VLLEEPWEVPGKKGNTGTTRETELLIIHPIDAWIFSGYLLCHLPGTQIASRTQQLRKFDPQWNGIPPTTASIYPTNQPDTQSPLLIFDHTESEPGYSWIDLGTR
jgi:hypothetical protein